MRPLFWRKKKEERHHERLPPKQRWIPGILKWGVEHPGVVAKLPEVSLGDWRLKLDGLVESPTLLTWGEFVALPQAESVSDFHCVETWSVQDQRWEGVRFRDLADRVKPTGDARHVFFECMDTYTTDLPLAELMGDDVILAHRLNGEPLPQPLGGPMRLIVPHKYAYKSPMWLSRITFMKDNRLGFWESGFYSDTADPWRDDRYRFRA